MKRLIFINMLLGVWICTLQAQVPSCSDLKETGGLQRRDLSTIGSRMVINPYDFNVSPVKVTPSVYSNSPAIPLNIGYLTAHNSYKETEKRFGREYKGVLEIRNRKDNGPLTEAVEFETAWYPHALSFCADYGGGNKISGNDYFYNDCTVIRAIEFNEKGKYILSGLIKGKSGFDSKSKTILINSSDCKYAIGIGGLNEKYLRYYESSDDLKMQQNELQTADGARYWSYEINKRGNIYIAVSFLLASESDRELIDRTKEALSNKNARRAYERQLAFWNEFLKIRIPHPLNFNLSAVDAKGVSDRDIKDAYYKAWVLLAQNVLMPESAVYPYYQIVTGKASLWDEGHGSAPFSAAWESFVAMQLFAYVDVDIAWSSLKGMLSLVDSGGMLGGESLPSRKAFTAWTLYELSGDKESLKEVYPAIIRYLNWRITHPRWIYNGMTSENEKDAEFVVSAIHDMEYVIKIAGELGDDDAWAEWQKKRNDFIDKYKEWFWKTPQELPVQHVNHYKGRDTNPIQITTGLCIDELGGDYLESMLGLFYKYYDTNNSFAGFDAPKYPDIDFTVRGLLRKRKTVLAKGLMEATIRDIIRTNTVFAETYTNDKLPLPGGVRPSIFGMAEIIDFVLIKNGYMFTNGTPSLINLYSNDRMGVDHIFYRGKYYNIQYEADCKVIISDSANNIYHKIVGDNEIRPLLE